MSNTIQKKWIFMGLSGTTTSTSSYSNVVSCLCFGGVDGCDRLSPCHLISSEILPMICVCRWIVSVVNSEGAMISQRGHCIRNGALIMPRVCLHSLNITKHRPDRIAITTVWQFLSLLLTQTMCRYSIKLRKIVRWFLRLIRRITAVPYRHIIDNDNDFDCQSVGTKCWWNELLCIILIEPHGQMFICLLFQNDRWSLHRPIVLCIKHRPAKTTHWWMDVEKYGCDIQMYLRDKRVSTFGWLSLPLLRCSLAWEINTHTKKRQNNNDKVCALLFECSEIKDKFQPKKPKKKIINK